MTTAMYKTLPEMWAAKKREFLDNCTLCGACMEVCPIYSRTSFADDEPSTAMERFNSFLETGKDAEAVKNFMSFCVKCGYCGEVCPLGTHLHHTAKDFVYCDLEDAGYGLVKTKAELPENKESVYRFFRGISPRPEDKYDNWLITMPENPPQVDYIYFPSCSSAAFTKRLFDTLDIFEMSGLDYRALSPFDIDLCCGCMHIMAGDIKTADKRARGLVAALNAFKPKVVVTGCLHTHWWLRDYISELVSYDFKAQHAVQFIADHLDKLQFKPMDNVTVAFHDSCGMGRWTREFDAPRKILKYMPGVNYAELQHNRLDATCCGLAAPKDMQDKMICDRLEETKSAGATLLTSVCVGCVMGFQRHTDKYGLDATNIVSFVSEGLGFNNEDLMQKYREIGDLDKIIEITRPYIERGEYTLDQAKRLIKRYLFNVRTLGLHDE